MTTRQMLVIADDLTGAADAGAPLAGAGLTTDLVLDAAYLDGRALDGRAHCAVMVVDTDSRDLTGDDARRAVRDAARRLAADRFPILVKKVDSLLRGPIAAELTGLLDVVPDALVVFAPALPAAGRTTVDGVQRIRGTALHHTSMWAAEHRRPADAIAPHLAPLPVARLGRHEIRGTGAAAALAASTAAVVVCDAETDADLDAIVRAGLASGRRICWAGTAGLTAAFARHLRPVRESATVAFPARGSFLAVIGSADPAAAEQVDELRAGGAGLVDLPATVLRGEPSARTLLAAAVRRTASQGDTVVRVTGPVDPARRRAVADGLAGVVAPAAAGASLLVLTGGATARRVLTAIGVADLRLRGEPEPGVGYAEDPATGRLVLTKAGSFGDPHTLTRAIATIRKTTRHTHQPLTREEHPA